MSDPDPNLTEKCLRCGEKALAILPEATDEVTFYECKKCRRHYAKKPGEALHDRWMNPIRLVLYPMIFHRDPREHIGRIAELFVEQKDRDEIITTVHAIDRELKEPTQRVSEILDFVHSPSEKIVREFLRGVSVRLKLDLRKSQGFDGPCSVCGKPGSVQQIPGAPVSGCFCKDHVPSGSIRPIHIFIALAVFSGLGWLIYILF